MRNQDRLPVPYALGICSSGALSAAGVMLGTVSDTPDGAVIALCTNGGTVIAVPAYSAQAAAPEPDPDPGE